MVKQIIIKSSLLLIASILISACKTQNQVLFENNKSDLSQGVVEIQKGTNTSDVDDQIINVGDDLEVKNLKSESLISGVSTKEGSSGKETNAQFYPVDKDSMVVLPVIGKTKLGGLSIAKATEYVNKMYEKSLLQNPIITLSIANRKVTLLGEFSQPGNYPLVKDKTHLVEVVGAAGGLVKQANMKKIKIIRGNYANPQILLVDLSNIKTLQDQRLYLQNNDVIYAEPSIESAKADANNSRQSIISISLAALNILLVVFNLTK